MVSMKNKQKNKNGYIKNAINKKYTKGEIILYE